MNKVDEQWFYFNSWSFFLVCASSFMIFKGYLNSDDKVLLKRATVKRLMYSLLQSNTDRQPFTLIHSHWTVVTNSPQHVQEEVRAL